MEESIRRGRADDPGTRNPVEMLRGFGLMKDGQILRTATVLFGRAERIEAELPQGLPLSSAKRIIGTSSPSSSWPAPHVSTAANVRRIISLRSPK